MTLEDINQAQKKLSAILFSINGGKTRKKLIGGAKFKGVFKSTFKLKIPFRTLLKSTTPKHIYL